eukprot:jgi/Botrbrau1/17833/Bobra.0127s0077.2
MLGRRLSQNSPQDAAQRPVPLLRGWKPFRCQFKYPRYTRRFICRAAMPEEEQASGSGLSARSRFLRWSAAGVGGALAEVVFRPPSESAMAYELDLPGSGQVLMRTLSDSELAVSFYPSFAYNSLGGGGIAEASEGGRHLNLTFNPTAVRIPPVDSRTTKFLGIPMVPGLRIDVVPAKLEVQIFSSQSSNPWYLEGLPSNDLASEG